jgi:hypothetical protein
MNLSLREEDAGETSTVGGVNCSLLLARSEEDAGIYHWNLSLKGIIEPMNLSLREEDAGEASTAGSVNCWLATTRMPIEL